MTKKEILEEFGRLKAEVEEIKDQKQDIIYLLSAEEYEEYKNEIPHTNTWWWLRSPGILSFLTANVNANSLINSNGLNIDDDTYAVRPALRYSNLKSEIIKSKINNKRFLFNDFPFIIIDEEKEIAIAETPISFDKFDNESNNYENSYIRKWLLDWIK